MNNKERLFLAFDNKPVDTVPVGFWFHFLQEDQMDDALVQPQLADINMAGHKKYIDSFHPDFVKIMSDGYFHYPVGRGETYETPKDLDKITLVEREHPWITKQVELVKSVVALQEDTAYFYNFFSPIGNLQWIIGEDTFYNFLEQDPEQIMKTLDIIARGQVILAKALIEEAGADGIYFSVSNPDQSRLSDEVYRDVITPGEKYILTEIHKLSKYHILHICGYRGRRNNLSLYRDYPAKAVNWAVNEEGVSLRSGKEFFGKRAVIGGFANSEGSLIQNGTEAEIKSFTRTLLRDAGTKGVVIGADCTIPGDTDLRRLEWVREAVKDI